MTEKFYYNIFEETEEQDYFEEQKYFMNSDLLDIRDRVLAKCNIEKEDLEMDDDDCYNGRSPIEALFLYMYRKMRTNDYCYCLREYIDLFY